MHIAQYGPDDMCACWECGEKGDLEIRFEQMPKIGVVTPLGVIPVVLTLCFKCREKLSFEGYYDERG